MQKHRDLTLGRFERFKDELRESLYSARQALDLHIYAAPGRISYTEALAGTYEAVELGTRLGPLWSTHWARLDITIPAAWAGAAVHLRWDSSSEACIWRDGHPLSGLSGSGDYWHSPYHDTYPLTDNAHAGEQQTLYVEIAVNNPFGQPRDARDLGLLRTAEIAVFQPDRWALYWDFVVIADMARHLPEDSPRAGEALRVANAMINAYWGEDVTPARDLAAAFFAQHTGQAGHMVYAVGHAHIDTAWLWPLAETKRKCVRSFSTALRLMDAYPSYQFVCSQAQQLAWMKAEQPDLYARIRERVADGRFIPVGGAWVEPDCNIPSGESLIRQFLYGQRFYQQEFGQMHQIFWLPDTFGYPAALPQIMQGVGIRYFLTQKLSWNQFNKLPANTFYWQGLDGSRVLTHFPPADTYNGLGNVEEILGSMARFRDHERSQVSLYLYGFGDGGGGPSEDMLEQLNRMADVDGLPRLQQTGPDDFFETCEADAHDLTTWVGELYFEAHRGTYTTQAFVKWANRRAEGLLHDVEFLAALLPDDYPRAELDRLWQLVLLNQFHDILPGSSIREVYEDARAHYDDILSSAAALRQAALDAHFSGEAANDTVTVINTLGQAREDVIEHDGNLILVNAPPFGYRTQTPRTEPEHPVRLTQTDAGFVLENRYLRAALAPNGHVLSLYDKQHAREALAAPANRFALHDDRPIAWDAWDIDIYAHEKKQYLSGATSAEVIESGPLRAAVRFEYSISQYSHLTQLVSLSATDDYLIFSSEAEWGEAHKLLRVEFPLAVHTPQAHYETQFGIVQRPTHMNTAWDMARFEVCGHRWAALTEYGYGVALLNDCKYGHSARGNVLGLSLLRGPQWPDATADQGAHTFRYALMPFNGRLEQAVRAGQRFNIPLLVHTGAVDVAERSFFRVEPEQVILDTVKRAEDDDALILRFYEACGGHARVALQTSLPLESARYCDLLERAGEFISIEGDRLYFDMTPFQIVSVKLTLAR
ncbi:MAG: alpha-mannosidase [Anaerolineales bacterium]